MNIVSYLENVYGYDTPIFLKDVRIGGKSKAAIKESFYRATKEGHLSRKGPGIYSLVRKEKGIFRVVVFEDIVARKFLYSTYVEDYKLRELFTIGYYSGMTFLNQIHISEQVPAVLEITTNNTSSNKRLYVVDKRRAILRKGKTKITFQNYKILQFLDMFHWLSLYEIKEKRELLVNYIKENGLSKQQFSEYISLYGFNTLKKITEGGLLDAFVK
jgi:hypothetical protein